MKMTYKTFDGREIVIKLDQKVLFTKDKDEAEMLFQVLNKHTKVEYEREWNKEEQEEHFCLRWCNIIDVVI